MLYSEKHNLAFIHVPKTGGVSFRRFLQTNIPDMTDLAELPGPHHTVAELFSFLRKRGQAPADTRIVTLARDPFALVKSHYTYWRSNPLSQEDLQLPHVIGARTMTFPDFVRTWVKQDLYHVALVVDRRLPVNVEFIRLERLFSDVDFLFNEVFRLNIGANIPHLNGSSQRITGDLYDDETRSKVRRLYQWFFNLKETDRLNPRRERAVR